MKERTDGASSALEAAGFPRDKIYRSAEKTTDVPGGFDAMNTLLTQHPEAKHWLVYSVNDEGVLGAIRALENRGFNAGTIIGIGIGARPRSMNSRRKNPRASRDMSPQHLPSWI